MSDLKQKFNTTIWFPGTIDGFNEKFAKRLYLDLKTARVEGTLYMERVEDSDGDYTLEPGYQSVCSHLDHQIKFYSGAGPMWRCPNNVDALLAEAEGFFEAIATLPNSDAFER
jgi:hypothetical protein